MIKVDKKFYESGLTMEGEGNRIFLKGKNEEDNIEMKFLKENWVAIVSKLYTLVVDFHEIEEISMTYKQPLKLGPIPVVRLKNY